MKKSAHQVGIQDNSDPEYFDELGDSVYIHTDAHDKHQPGGKEETPYPVPNQC